MATSSRRQLIRLLLASPLLGVSAVSCTQEQREQMAESAQQTAVALAKEKAKEIVVTTQAEIITRIPEVPQLPGSSGVPQLFEGLPIANSKWHNGFGAIEFARKFPSYYTETSGLHGGIDFGNSLNTPVVARVTGKIVEHFPGDADPNVVVQVGKYFVLYGHTQRKDGLKIGSDVNPGDTIGHLVWQKDDNYHLHLSVRIDSRSYNPVYFFKQGVLDTISWSTYSKDENLWSMKSFLYTTENYWKDYSNPKIGIER